jgi:hypothetical protein
MTANKRILSSKSWPKVARSVHVTGRIHKRAGRTGRIIQRLCTDIHLSADRGRIAWSSELLLRADESLYVREIARLTGVPAGSLHRELKLLTSAGLFERSTAGNQVRYQADRTCPIHEELAGIFRKTAGLEDVLREALVRAG